MKCTVPGPNIKVLGRAIHSLAKIGNELYLEFTDTELSFRTVNPSKTAYATFQFCVDFFSYFSSDGDDSSESPQKCQISLKSSLAVFKSPMTMGRTVDSLQILMNPNCDKLVFVVKYKKGFSRTFNIPVIDCETLQAYYHKDNAPNKLIVRPRIIYQTLSSFQHNQIEITWKVTKECLLIRNYSESETDSASVRTEFKVDKMEFEEYKVENETEITFCLKELRAVLLFSDCTSIPLTVYFITSSKPIVFALKGDVFEADIVVSTLTGSDYVDTQSVRSPVRDKEIVAEETIEECNRVGELSDNDNDLFLCNVDRHEKVMAADQTRLKNTIGTDSVRKKREKLKHVFQRCFNNEEFDVKKLPGYDVVLASDSDSNSEKE